MRGQRAPGMVLRGHVTGVDGDALVTNIILPPWPASGLGEDDWVKVRVAGTTLVARFVGPEQYQQVMRDPGARDALDVDVLCTIGPDGALVVIGLGGDLVRWLQARSGMPVTLERP